ncbi:MAG: hypothetical protein C0523_09600 [Cytophaga sp.]|nr:hypothetical protein [Cytophaga sp.]
MKITRIFYWIAFALTILTLLLNVGIGLIALAIFILPILVLHFLTGLSLVRLQNHRLLIFISASNLFLFALLRPDGVHTLNENGLSALLNEFNIHGGYNQRYENELTVVSLALLVIQAIIEIILFRIKKRLSKV